MKGAGKRESGDTRDSVESAVESVASRQSVDGGSLVSEKKTPTAEEVEDNLSQRRMEKWEKCGSMGMWCEKKEEGPSRPGCRSKYWADEDQRVEPHAIGDGRVDRFSKTREDRRDGISKIRQHRREVFSQIRQDREDGFVQSSKDVQTSGEDTSLTFSI